MTLQRPQWSPWQRDIISGSAAGIAALFVVYPLDTLRTRLQTSGRFSGPLDCAKKTLLEEGARGFYKGLMSPLFGQILYKSIIFGTLGSTTRLIHGDPSRPIPLHKFFVCASLAGGACCFVSTPIELVRSRLQVQYAEHITQGPRYSGVYQCVRDTFRAQGVRGIWKGLYITLCRDVPGVGIWCTTHEALRRRFLTQPDTPAWKKIGCGGMAGMAFWLSVFPLDVIKSNIQAQRHDQVSQVSGIAGTARLLFKEGGFFRFYRGVSVALVRGFGGSAVTFFTLQKVNELL
eukprot:TRINITY_DN2113_c0_g1_i2.p1 TRINITY_DN2113_c0_g1~~TRINITY_DN2113_c0_g1_i2.p1  ORF type:complete len:289 (+),score=49.64 TRINITY_DN2113_c0_g1_i2:69-935(+)